MAPSGRHGGSSWKLKTHIFNHTQKAERGKFQISAAYLSNLDQQSSLDGGATNIQSESCFPFFSGKVLVDTFKGTPN